MYRTTPFQNPATARTAGSCERTGATKAPVLSPAIPSTGGFTHDSGGKRVPAAVTNFHHTAPTGAANFLQRVRMLIRPCSPDTAAHRAKRGRNCWGLNDREKMASWLLCQRYRNSGDRQSHGSSLCPSARRPPKVGPGFCPELRPAYSRARCLPCRKAGNLHPDTMQTAYLCSSRKGTKMVLSTRYFYAEGQHG